jgi:type IV pilus assembly protein PilQ
MGTMERARNKNKTMKTKKRLFFLISILFFLPLIQLLAVEKKCDPPSQIDPIITLDFKKIPIRELLQFIAEAMQANIMMSESVTGNVSLHFRNVTWSKALDVILEMSGLVIKKEKDNIWLIATPREFAERQKILTEASPMKVIKFNLHHTDAMLISTTLKTQADILSPMAKVSVNPRENSLWIKENAMNLPSLLNYLHQIDLPEKQILISAKIINIDDNKIHELGIHFNGTMKSPSSEGLNVSLPITTSNSLQIAIATLPQNQLLNLQLDALETAGYSKIMADPQIITQNRKLALIEAGEEIPYQETTSSGATSVTFKKATLSLKVTPTTLPDGQIILELEISQNKISPLAVNGTPAIQTQELKTQVIVHDGQTVILGGIYESSNSKIAHKIPLIANLPLIGSLLSHKNRHFIRKELLIFISPHVL